MLRAAVLTLVLAISLGSARAQPVELKPMELPEPGDLPTMYRFYYGPSAERARELVRLREEARRTHWAEEAKRIAQAGKNVVRDDDNLYVYLDAPDFPRALVFKTIWGLDPGVFYSYEAFDEIGQFHIVYAGAVDNEGYFLLIAAKTGMVYRVHGMPVYSPDKSRFFAQAFNGMGCIEGVAVYRRDGDKLYLEATQAMGCDQPCSHEWAGPGEIRSNCKSSSGDGRVDYRLTLRDGVWQETKSP